MTEKKYVRIFTLMAMLAMSFLVINSPYLYGKEKEISDVQDISFEELINVKVTVASKWEEKLMETPSSVSVFTADDIRHMGIANLEELLNFVPGFQTGRDVEQGTANRISARGRSTALSESVLVLINGQRINDLYTGGVSILNRQIAVENIKQVEIIRGPGSALYGSNAFLGVVNIVTDDNINNVSFKLGNLYAKEIAVNFSKKFSRYLFISSFVKVFSDNGYQYKNIVDMLGNTGDTRDPSKGMDAYVTFTYKDFTLQARHMERDLQDFLTFGNLGNDINRESTKQSSIFAFYRIPFSKSLNVKVGLGYLADRWLTVAQIFPKGFEVAPGFVLNESLQSGPDLKSYYTNLSLDINYQVTTANRLSLGFAYMITGITEVTNMWTHDPITLDFLGGLTRLPDEITFNEKKDRKILGIYIQDKHSLGKHFSLTGGIRLDHYDDFGSSINPRAAAIYSAPWGGILKLMYGRAFRAPNFMELYDKNNPIDFGNPNLKPEKAETIEFAYYQTFKFLHLSFTYFYNHIQDIIILGDPVVHPYNPLEAPGFINSGELTTRGLEFELRCSPVKNLILRGTYTHHFDGDGLYISPISASLVLNYRFKRWNFNINGIFREKTKLLAAQDSYFLVNTALHFSIKPGLELIGIVKNMFSESYLTVSQAFPQGVMNRGRTFSLGIFAKL